MNAWSARPARIVTHKQVISATRFVMVTRTVYADVLLIDRMHDRGQLSDRQHDAACRLYGLFTAAGLGPRTTARVDTVAEEPDDDAASAELPDEDARVVYRRLLRHVGPVMGPVLDAMMHDQHPGWRLDVAQDGLGILADGWGMEK